MPSRSPPGLACEGLVPVVAIYSTFLQRAYDQLIHDVALQNLPVVFALDRAGLVGSDGATHQGAYDLSFLRCIPNMVLMAPADENECRQMLYTATTLDGPAAVRYPRGTGPGVPVEPEMTALPVGRGEIRREGRSGLAILCFGTLLDATLAIGERLDATRGEHALRQAPRRRAGAATARAPSLPWSRSRRTPSRAARVPRSPSCSPPPAPPRRCCCSASRTAFIEHGSREDCLAAAGLDRAGLARTIEAWWNARNSARARLVGG